MFPSSADESAEPDAHPSGTDAALLPVGGSDDAATDAGSNDAGATEAAANAAANAATNASSANSTKDVGIADDVRTGFSTPGEPAGAVAIEVDAVRSGHVGSTGGAGADLLDELADREVADRPEVYERIHAQLREALAEIDDA